jgi:hypothetical protein
MLEIVGSFLAIFILSVIAFPKFFAPPEPKRKKVGATHWGYYEGASEHEDEEAGKVLVPKPMRHNHPVAGSQSYARGPGGKGS